MAPGTYEEFDEALTALDFERADAAITTADADAQSELRARYEEERADAEQRAEQLAGRIQSMARADHYEGLLALAQDSTTEPLLDLLSPEIKRGAHLHLDGAIRRQKRFQVAAEKHMDEARNALVLLDTTKARAELSRIDRRWLDAGQRSMLKGLQQQTEEAAAERRELEAKTAEVLTDHHPSQAPARSRDGGTSSQRRGCATPLIALVAIIGSVAAATL